MKNERMMKRYIRDFYTNKTEMTFLQYWEYYDPWNFAMERQVDYMKNVYVEQLAHPVTTADRVAMAETMLEIDNAGTTTDRVVLLEVDEPETRLQRRRGLLDTTMDHFRRIFS